MALPLNQLGIKSYSQIKPSVPQVQDGNDVNFGMPQDGLEIPQNTGIKPAIPLDQLNIKSYRDIDTPAAPMAAPITDEGASQEISSEKPTYDGENPAAAFAKNSVAGFVGGIPDIGVGVHNLVASKDNQWPGVTDMISNAIDKATGGYTKDTGAMSKHSARFLSSLFGGGAAGKAIQAVGAANKLGKASSATEKTGSFIANNLGLTSPSVKNISAGLAGGAAVGASEIADLPIYAEIPAVIGAFVLGGKLGGKASGAFRDSEMLKPLFEKIPGLQKFIQKQNYEDLAKNINPEAIGDLLKTSLIDKEISFLTEKTLSEIPEKIRVKLKDNPALLNDQEVEYVVEKGMKDFTSQIEKIEKEFDISLTAGEYTGSPKIIAKEDALANKPNIEVFDIATKNRKAKLSKSLEKISNDLSSESTDPEKLGQIIAKEVDSVYSSAEKLRSDNWNERFGAVIDEPIFPITNYQNKLKEFAKLRPDSEGFKVAIRTAKERLNDGIQYEKSISPKRMNDILVGMNQDIRRFPQQTFARKQMNELKASLEKDMDVSIANPSTAEQASLIREARAGYAEDSKILDQIDESILFKKIGEESLLVPEKIAKSLDVMPASQLKLTFDALKRSDKYHEVIPQIQKHYLENAIKAATKTGSDSFNPRIFLDKLPKKAEFDVIFGGTKAYTEIKDLSVLLHRMVKFQPSRSNSKTAQRAQADRGDLEEGLSEAALDATKGKFSGTLSFLKDQFARLGSYDKTVAELLVSPQHRKNILDEVGKSNNKRPVLAALAQALR